MPEPRSPRAAAPLGESDAEVLVFHIDLGDMDLLLAASDFYAAAAQSDYRLDPDPRAPEARSPAQGGTRLLAKGSFHECIRLEPLLQLLFSPTLPAGEGQTTAFLMKGPEGGMAFLVEREFEMLSLPLREFRLFPSGLRARVAARGLAALRFAGGKRLQVLMSVGALAPAATEGGGVSRSS